MARALRLLSRRRLPRRIGPGCGLAAAFAAIAACGSGNDCQFRFGHDAVNRDDVPWVCTSGTAPPLTLFFAGDGSGTLNGTTAFTWQVTSCRTLALDLTASMATIDLSELGGNVEVGRLTFVLDGSTYLCGYGVPPP